MRFFVAQAFQTLLSSELRVFVSKLLAIFSIFNPFLLCRMDLCLNLSSKIILSSYWYTKVLASGSRRNLSTPPLIDLLCICRVKPHCDVTDDVIGETSQLGRLPSAYGGLQYGNSVCNAKLISLFSMRNFSVFKRKPVLVERLQLE